MKARLLDVALCIVRTAHFIDGLRRNGQTRDADLQSVLGQGAILDFDFDRHPPAAIRKSRTHLDRPLLFSDAGASDSDFVNSFRYLLECESAIEINIGVVDEPAVDRFNLRPLQVEV